MTMIFSFRLCFFVLGSNECLPKNRMTKIFLMIYTVFGIPLTFVFLTDLSDLMKQLIMNLSAYFSRTLLNVIRRLYYLTFLEDLLTSSNIQNRLSILQLIVTLFIYLFIGAYLFASKTFLESFYLMFTMLFTIHFNTQIYQNHNFFAIMIYAFFGLAIVLLCIELVKDRLEIFVGNVGKRLMNNLVELTQQMGKRKKKHEINKTFSRICE